ncbi:ATP-binding protein [Streptomyces sp. G45]|uniref:ATP-binding protein n=1 Tax=Streptomyces sp. G45 TaxID=3406627 RepID=UPI003C21CB74
MEEGVPDGLLCPRWRDLHEEADCQVWERKFPGLPTEAFLARCWMRKILYSTHFVTDGEFVAYAELVATELFVNAIQHTASGRESGRVLLALAVSGRGVTVSVTDEGKADGLPRLKSSTGVSEGGRGLFFIDWLARRIVIHQAASGGSTVAADLVSSDMPSEAMG